MASPTPDPTPSAFPSPSPLLPPVAPSVLPLAAPTGWALVATWITFGIISVASKNLGVVFPKIGLPLITGYLVVGAVAGPFGLGLIHKQDLQPLSLVTQFALAFISFAAGAELYLPELRSLFKKILYSTSMISVVTFCTCTAIITGLASSSSGIIPFMEALPLGCRASVAAIASAIMVARSPASAIAVVKELKAAGTFTSTILGVTVLGDVYVLLLFTLTTTIAESECKGEGFSGLALGITVAVILGSILLGYLVGFFLLALMNVKRFPLRYLILPLGLAIFVACHWFTDYSNDEFGIVIALEPLLICITAGYVCTNRSSHRHRFISVLQQAGPYVFLPFFTLTGASLDLRVMLQSFGFAAILAVVRATCIFIGSSTGGYLAGVRPYKAPTNMLMWMCLLTQAGVSLGLASEVGMSFPEWGRAFQTAIIGIVLINQIIGPILFKIAVRRIGEAGKASADDNHDEDAVIPTAVLVGSTPMSFGVAVRLLASRWNVTMVCGTEQEAKEATEAITKYAEEVREAEHRAKTRDVVAGLTQGMKDLASQAAGAAAQLGAGGSPAGAAAAAAAAAEEHHGHEKKRKLEEGFTALPLTASTDTSFNPLHSSSSSSSSSSPSTSSASGGLASNTSAGIDARFGPLAELVATSARTLAAVVYACVNDSASHSAAVAVDAVIRGAPKKSSLHAVRHLAILHSPGWASAFQALGVMPLHAELHASHVAMQLVSAPRARPVVLLPPSANADELCKNVGKVLQGPHLWKIADEGSAAGAVGPSSIVIQQQAQAAADAATLIRRSHSSGRVSGSPRAGGGSSSSAGAANSVMAALRMEGEEVGEWANARDEYIDSLHGLDENNAGNGGGSSSAVNDEEDAALGGGVMSGLGGGGGSRRKNNIEEVAMYGFLRKENPGDEEEAAAAGEAAGKKGGLAAQDSAAASW